jgi:hypothetical protein
MALNRVDGSWRTVEMFVLMRLPDDKFADYMETHIRGIAHDSGDSSTAPRSAPGWRTR